MSKCTWTDSLGKKYTFDVYDMKGGWLSVGGVYIFAVPPDGYLQPAWGALYVGRTGDFAARMPTHERWSEAQRRGATRVHALVVATESARMALESSLIKALRPPMNTLGLGLELGLRTT